MALHDNLGSCPPFAKRKRVRVILRNGYDTKGVEPSGWPADGNFGCRWTLTNHPFDILRFEVIR